MRLEQDVLDETWQHYRETEDIEARNALMLHYASLVRYIAFKVVAGLPSSVERDDLVSYGQFGLLKALKSFDPERGVKFETYAGPRIRGQIIDELRTLDFVPRSVRSKTRDVERAIDELQVLLGRPAEDAELAEHLGVSLPELWALRSNTHSSGAIHALMDSGELQGLPGTDGSSTMTMNDIMMDRASSPADAYDVQELGEILSEVIHSLPERHKMILGLCYLEEMTLAEVGAILGVTESRVSQLQGKILGEIRERLGRQVFTAA